MRVKPIDDWISEFVCILAAGDITRHAAILWGFTLDECRPYLEYQQRQILFREAVIALSGAEPKQKRGATNRSPLRKEQAVGDYCKGTGVLECRGMFGEGLASACATCPD